MKCSSCGSSLAEEDDGFVVLPNGGLACEKCVSKKAKEPPKERKSTVKNISAIKYRPQRFEEVVGNDLIKSNLSSTRIRNKIPNAILLTGYHGIGKTTLARIYAKYVNCQNPVQKNGLMEPCCECDTCKYIQDGKPFDLNEINAADHRGIDDMRNLLEMASQGHTDLEYRVWIIDEAQQLTPPKSEYFVEDLGVGAGKECLYHLHHRRP